jgi:hypothetical protein
MAYTTQQDLDDAAGGSARFVELADFDGDGAADAAMVARCQAAADGFVDQHLRKYSPADLAALRATPTATIKRIAADEAIFRLREQRRQISEDDRKSQELRRDELRALGADEIRPADTKTARARFVENESDVSREGTKGMW